MAFTLVAHTLMRGSGTASASLDTTGCSLIVVSVSTDGTTVPAVADSKGNTWSLLSAAASKSATLFVSQPSPTVGTGHTFTVTGSFPSSTVLAYSATTPVIDRWRVATGSSATLQPGSITPQTSGALLVCTLNTSSIGATAAINSSFTIEESASESASFDGVFTADRILGAAAATNPTWTVTGGTAVATVMVAFVESNGGGSGGAAAYVFVG